MLFILLYFILLVLTCALNVISIWSCVFLKRYVWIYVLMCMCLLNSFACCMSSSTCFISPLSLVVLTVPVSCISFISCTSGYPSLKVTFRRWLNVHISIMRTLSLAAYRYIRDISCILNQDIFISLSVYLIGDT